MSGSSKAVAAEIVEDILFDLERHWALDEGSNLEPQGRGVGFREKLRMEWRRLAEDALRRSA